MRERSVQKTEQIFKKAKIMIWLQKNLEVTQLSAFVIKIITTAFEAGMADEVF